MHRLMLLQMILLALFEAFHRAFALDHKKRVIGAGMTMQLIVDPWLVAVQGDVATIGLRWTNVITSSRLSPLGLFFGVHNRNLANFPHLYLLKKQCRSFERVLLLNLQDVSRVAQALPLTH
jgi:hypothetical protein